MLLDPGEPIFDDVPTTYISPFPGRDTLLDEKFAAFLDAETSAGHGKTRREEFAVMQAGEAFTTILSICNKVKAVDVGDLLTDWLPRVAWMGEGKTGAIPMGLFASVPWGRLAGLKPDELVKVMGNAALTVALTTMAAVPVYGQIAAALVGAGRLMYRFFESKADLSTKRLALPWTDYSSNTDERWVTAVQHSIFRSTNWTELFAPPFKQEPWRVSLHGTTKDPKGLVFMPANQAGDAAWSDSGLGCMPGTFRVAGQIQGVPPKSREAALIRRMMRPKGITPREVAIPWRQELTACGDYLPSLAQLGAATWQQVQAAGNPDMYKVSVQILDDAWEKYFKNLWASAQQAMYDAGGTIGATVGYDTYQAANLVSQLVEPYLCHRLRGDAADPYAGPWELGVPEGYRPHALFHEKMFKLGPAELSTRNSCLFVETNSTRKSPYWPYGNKPKEHPSLRPGSYEPSTTPATAKVPAGYRCVEYPPHELQLAQWGSPYDVFIKPQLDALAKRQWECLASTLVCAYVRPVGYDGLAPYDAFDDAKPGDSAFRPRLLLQRCLDIREQLLKNDARFLVNLKDVHAIDPKFEAQLRSSGVNNSPAQMTTARFKLKASAGGALETDDAPEDPPPTGGGVAFGELVGDRGGDGPRKAGLGLGLGLGGLGLGAYLWSKR